MTSLTPRTRRFLAAVTLLPLALALSACGARYDITVEDDDTVNVTMLMWGTIVSQDHCTRIEGQVRTASPGVRATTTSTRHKGQSACRMSATGIPLGELRTVASHVSLRHSDDMYEVDINVRSVKYEAYLYPGVEATLTMTFPGEVTQADGQHVTVDGNTVTWTNLLEESAGSLHAEARDRPSLPWALIAAGAALLVLVAVVLVVLVVLRRRSAAAQGYTIGQAPFIEPTPYGGGYPSAAPPGPAPQAPQGLRPVHDQGPAPQGPVYDPGQAYPPNLPYDATAPDSEYPPAPTPGHRHRPPQPGQW